MLKEVFLELWITLSYILFACVFVLSFSLADLMQCSGEYCLGIYLWLMALCVLFIHASVAYVIYRYVNFQNPDIEDSFEGSIKKVLYISIATLLLLAFVILMFFLKH